MKKTITMNEWVKAIDELIVSRCEEVPDGWKTTVGIAQETGKSVPWVKTLLGRMQRIGRLERRNFRIMTEKRCYPVPHYRIKK